MDTEREDREDTVDLTESEAETMNTFEHNCIGADEEDCEEEILESHKDFTKSKDDVLQFQVFMIRLGSDSTCWDCLGFAWGFFRVCLWLIQGFLRGSLRVCSGSFMIRFGFVRSLFEVCLGFNQGVHSGSFRFFRGLILFFLAFVWDLIGGHLWFVQD